MYGSVSAGVRTRVVVQAERRVVLPAGEEVVVIREVSQVGSSLFRNCPNQEFDRFEEA